MRVWLRRILALWLISLGVALIFFPFDNERSGGVESEVVSLHKQELLDPGGIATKFPGMKVVDIAGPELNVDDYPGIWDAVIYLDKKLARSSSDLKEWNRFQESVLGGISGSRLVVFREGLIKCDVGIEPDAKGDGKEAVFFTYLGRYNLKIKRLSVSDLADYPTIITLVKRLDAGSELDFKSNVIPMAEWNQMVEEYLVPLDDLQTFNFNGGFYGPEFGTDIIYMTGRVSGLSTILKVIGGVSLLIGVLLVSGLYIRKRGIMVNPQMIAILYDVIVLVFSIPAAYMVAGTTLTKVLYITEIINDDFGIFMGNFFFFFGIPFTALFTSRFTAQSVDVDAKGIHVDSLMGKNSITWESLESMDFSDEYVVVGRVGVMMPRQLQKTLILESKMGQTLTINEPQLKSVKEQISLRFQRYVPDNKLRDRIRLLLADWEL